MEQYKIGEVEMRFAEIVWRMEPVSLEKLAEAVKAEFGWKKSETEIMIKQLCERGIFTLEKDLIKAKIARSAFQRIESNIVSAYTARENVKGKSFAGFRHSFWAPVAFEEGDVKSRIKNIMKCRKTITVAAVCSNPYEQQGTADYSFTAYYVDDAGGVVIDNYGEVSFRTEINPERNFEERYQHTREEMVPEFKERISPYIEDAEILISLDIYTAFYSTKERKCPASEFFNTVWERKDGFY